MPYPSLLHPEPLSLWQTTACPYLHRRYSNTVLSQSLWGPWVLVCTKFVWASERLWKKWGLIINMNLPLLPSCWAFSFALGSGVSPHNRSSAYCLTGVSYWPTMTPFESESECHTVLSNSVIPWTVACPAPLSMKFPLQSTGVGCYFLFQGIFLAQGSNPGLLNCRQILYH